MALPVNGPRQHSISSLSQQQEAAFAAAAGVDVNSYRLLQALQTRDITSADYDLLVSVSTQANKRTLSLEKVEAYPKVVCGGAAAATWGEAAAPGATCLVCQFEMEEGEMLRRLPCACAHVFHAECIDEWLVQSAARCPVDQQMLS